MEKMELPLLKGSDREKCIPITVIVGLIGWVISFRSFVQASCDAAASVKWAGLWPKLEE